MSSVLSVAVKRRRLKHSDVSEILRLLKGYGFDTDVSFGEKYAEQLFELSRLYDVSAYDSAYLELAIRKHSTLATLDDWLIGACEKAGVGILGREG